MEIWKNIKNYNDLYKISNKGNVISFKRYKKGKILKPIENHGYLGIRLYKNGKQYYELIHRLVAEHFLENPENKKYVNHKDFNRANNCVENLEWVTALENEEHKVINKKNIIKCYTPNNEILYFKTINQCARTLNLCNSCIRRCLIKKHKQHKNYRFEYVPKNQCPLYRNI